MRRIRPAHGRIVAETLAVVQVKARNRRRIADRLLAPEHQESSDGQPLAAAAAVTAPAAEFFQQSAVVFALPDVLGASAEQGTELAQGFSVDVVERKAFQNPAVGRFLGLIRKHPAHLGLGAAVIAFMIAPERPAQGVAADEHRTLPPVRPRHQDAHHARSFRRG